MNIARKISAPFPLADFRVSFGYNGGVMKILLTGASGLLGHAVALAAQKSHQVTAQYRRNIPPGPGKIVRLDIADTAALEKVFRETAPDVTIHCAAISDPVTCEQKHIIVKAVNVTATQALARLCGESRSRMILISTDLVFNGRRGMYVEADPVDPISFYGESKVKAEKAVRDSCRNHVIARCCLLYGRSLSGKRGADERILDALRNGKEVVLFTNEYRTPTCVPDIAQALIKIAESDFAGTLHCGGAERISRYDFGLKICRAAGVDPSRIAARKIEDLQSVPPRAPDVSLDSTKVAKRLGIRLLGVDEGLKLLYGNV
jgi:dTDP-4-dehydrorhamnose reductase